jgi:hypothetical protein
MENLKTGNRYLFKTDGFSSKYLVEYDILEISETV